MHTSATSQVRGDQPRIRCSISFESDNQPPLQLGIPTVSIIAPATAASNFGGVVTLHRHRDINKYMIIVHYYINAFLSSSSLLSLLLFFYYYYYHFFLGGCRFKKTFQKTTDVKDNVKVNTILCYFFLSDVRTLFSGISPVKNIESYKRELWKSFVVPLSSVKWSTTDSQLWLKTVTVAPSLMKEELGFFQSGPSSMLGTVRRNEYRTCHNFSKGFSCARTPCPHAHKCNKPG